MKSHVLKSKLLGNIFQEFSVDFAYLFGSNATGHADKNSDVDIAVFFSGGFSKMQRFDLRLKLAEKLGFYFKNPVDLVVLNDLRSLFFKYVIIKEGKLIYLKSEEKMIDFECKTMSEYFDFQPFLDLYNKNYVKNSL